jgi:iron-sulfur cluster assembly protein
MEYTMDVADVDPLTGRGTRRRGTQMIAPMAQMFLLANRLQASLETGFKFRNPNVTEACGCGWNPSSSMKTSVHERHPRRD